MFKPKPRTDPKQPNYYRRPRASRILPHVQCGQAGESLRIGLHRSGRRNYQGRVQVDVRGWEVCEYNPFDPRLIDGQRRRPVDDCLMIQVVVARKHINQNLTVRRTGSKSRERLVTRHPTCHSIRYADVSMRRSLNMN